MTRPLFLAPPVGPAVRSDLVYVSNLQSALAGTSFALVSYAMKNRKKTDRRRVTRDPQKIADRSRRQGVPEESLQGPPAAETTRLRGDRERKAEEEARKHGSTSPGLAGGDVDADWRHAASIGEEAPGGTVATPDQDVVDDLGTALGVPRAPDEEFRPSSEILEDRDRYRREEEE